MPVYQYQNKDGTKLWKFRAYAEDVLVTVSNPKEKVLLLKKKLN